MKKIAALLLTAAMMAATLTGCSSNKATGSDAAGAAETADTGGAAAEEEGGQEAEKAPAASDIKVALICSSSGLGDNSFNDAAWAGFNKAKEELGVEIKVVEPTDVADYMTSASTVAEAGYQLIFATGNDWGDTLTEVAALYPDTYFVGLNVNAEGDNVAVAQTADNEIGFLVGALAAMMSESDTVGFLGGKDVPSQVRFNVGYCEGAAHVNKDIQTLTTYVGAFNDPTTGKEYALEMMNQGADVIFHTAGQSGQGLFEAIRETEGVYAIGVDSDQDDQVEGKVLTSAMKRLDVIAYDMIKKVMNNEFSSGKVIYDLKNDGVGLTEFTYTADMIGEENLGKLEELKQGIIDGSIKVTDTYDEN